ncbi:MAG: NUDIX domain-containing protein [Candidatus ainarchaeum sp.]|nr:NUDIX domain-containing protein [Candidatus ainarchaeum sp.]
MNLFEIHVYGIIKNQNKILFLKSNGGLKKFMFPGGTLEKLESLEDCLKREIFEETGLKVKINSLIYAETLHKKDPPQLAIVFLCNTKKIKVKLSLEHNEYIWATKQKLKNLDIAHPKLTFLAKNQLKS